MNISGIAQTPIYPTVQPMEILDELSASSGAEVAGALNAASTQLAVSVEVQDMALSLMQDAADQLLQSMMAMAGIGQNVNMLA